MALADRDENSKFVNGIFNGNLSDAGRAIEVMRRSWVIQMARQEEEKKQKELSRKRLTPEQNVHENYQDDSKLLNDRAAGEDN